ncbi:MAG: tetratricopeptide repeat protein [Deltaproteobacteria bacterium]|jgi:tetratricopeptide (TPR) repeat protein|nr:tetratricopeptide repeat protein [Deltaproteobacteria bacterium]
MAKKVPINKLLRMDDAFLTTSERLFLYFKSHTRAIVVTVIVLAALGLIGFIVKSVHDSKVANSLEAFHQANIVPDVDARVDALLAVRTNYSGTKAARQAAYALLDNYLATADVEEALPLLDELIKSADASEESLKPLLLATQAGLFEQVGQLDLALESYKTAVSFVDKGQVTPIEEPFLADLLSSIGRVNLALGRTDDARKAYEDVILRTPNTYRSYAAQVKLSQTAPTSGAAKAAPGTEPASNADAPAEQAIDHSAHDHSANGTEPVAQPAGTSPEADQAAEPSPETSQAAEPSPEADQAAGASPEAVGPSLEAGPAEGATNETPEVGKTTADGESNGAPSGE